MKKVIVIILAVILTAVFGFSLYKVADYEISSKREKDAFDNLAAEVVKNDDGSDLAAEREILPRYSSLYKKNSDLFGWVKIEGTLIDYPVMYTPRDAEFYLHKSFEREYSASGTPFIAPGCLADGNYYIIYGHHMNNNSMFGTLPDYADEKYCDEHPIIKFDTLYERREYRVMAAYYGDDFKYYEYTDLSEREAFGKFVKATKAFALYDTGIAAEYGDELITLSTCDNYTQNGRFAVTAKRIR